MTWNSSGRKQELPSNWNNLRKVVLRRDHRLCKIQFEGCLGAASEVDHIIPGDNHSIENLRAACKGCHGKKSSYEGNAERSRRKKLRTRPPEQHPGLRKPRKT